jgi:hypothetical protein
MEELWLLLGLEQVCYILESFLGETSVSVSTAKIDVLESIVFVSIQLNEIINKLS